MIDARGFARLLTSSGDQSISFRLGYIDSGYVSGLPQIVFDGETSASTRQYPYLASYTPAADDRVLVAMVGHGGVVVGRIVA